MSKRVPTSTACETKLQAGRKLHLINREPHNNIQRDRDRMSDDVGCHVGSWVGQTSDINLTPKLYFAVSGIVSTENPQSHC